MIRRASDRIYFLGLFCTVCRVVLGARNLPKLPGDLSWDVDFKGCKEATRRAWHDPKKQGRTCQVYILDMSDLAGHAGVPACDLANFVTDLHQSLILPNPVRLGYDLPPRSRPEEEMMYPWGVGPHSMAQSSAPWFFHQGLLNSSYITGDINACGRRICLRLLLHDLGFGGRAWAVPLGFCGSRALSLIGM
eukprot:jgi/Botrbrau1/15550/Bobra.0273s0002.1